MRRYQSLRLVAGCTDLNRRRRQRQTGVAKFVSDSQYNDSILYGRLTRANPEKRLEFAGDVDWQLEYFCDALTKWLSRIFKWLASFFGFFTRICRRRRWEQDKKHDMGKLNDKDYKPPSPSASASYSDSLKIQPKRSLWRYNDCVPFVNRRILKRKWFKKPETRDWAKKSLSLFHQHVNRGFRMLCNTIEKDTKIYVGQTWIFRGDSTVLKSQSQLFRHWFQLSNSMREIKTTCVTPEEMEAILVYIYTLTWPMDMMTCEDDDEEWGDERQGRKGWRLQQRFLHITEMYGISLSLVKEGPFDEENKSLCGLLPIVETLRKRRVEQPEDILYDSFLHPNVQRCLSSSGGLCGEGDGNSTFEDIKNFHYSKRIPRKVLPSKHDDEDQQVKCRIVKDALRIAYEPRVHPGKQRTIEWVDSVPLRCQQSE